MTEQNRFHSFLVLSTGILLFFSIPTKAQRVDDSHTQGVGHDEEPVVTPEEAQDLFAKLTKNFGLAPHASLERNMTRQGILPIFKDHYWGVSCSNGKEAFGAVLYQNPGTGVVFKPYPARPLNYFSDRFAQASGLQSQISPMVEFNLANAINAKRTTDLPQIELHFRFFEELKRIDQGAFGPFPTEKMLDRRQAYLDGEGKDLLDKILAGSLGRDQPKAAYENALLRADRYFEHIWIKKKENYQREMDKLEGELRAFREKIKEAEGPIAKVSEFEEREYGRIFGSPPNEKNVPKGLHFLPLKGHIPEATVFQRTDAQGKVLEKVSAFKALPARGGFIYSIAKPIAAGAPGEMQYDDYLCQ